MTEPKTCAVVGCRNYVYGRGRCVTHYEHFGATWPADYVDSRGFTGPWSRNRITGASWSRRCLPASAERLATEKPGRDWQVYLNGFAEVIDARLVVTTISRIP